MNTELPCHILITLEFSQQIFEKKKKKLKYRTPKKSVQWDPELFRADRRTDMSKLTVAFPNFANAPKN